MRFPSFCFTGEYVILFIEGVDLATLRYDRRVRWSSSVGAQKRTMYSGQSARWPSFPLILGWKLNSCRQCVTVNCALISEQSSNYHLRSRWMDPFAKPSLRIDNLNPSIRSYVNNEIWSCWSLSYFGWQKWESFFWKKEEWKYEWFLKRRFRRIEEIKICD